MKHLLLLVEGKRADRPSYMSGLSKKGFEVESVATGSAALKKLETLEPKAVIVDAASMRTSGTRINPDGGIHLHARRVEFIHPVRKQPVVITAAPPNDPLWNAFLQLTGEEPRQEKPLPGDHHSSPLI